MLKHVIERKQDISHWATVPQAYQSIKKIVRGRYYLSDSESSEALSQCCFTFADFPENRLRSVTHLLSVVGNPREKPI